MSNPYYANGQVPNIKPLETTSLTTGKKIIIGIVILAIICVLAYMAGFFDRFINPSASSITTMTATPLTTSETETTMPATASETTSETTATTMPATTSETTSETTATTMPFLTTSETTATTMPLTSSETSIVMTSTSSESPTVIPVAATTMPLTTSGTSIVMTSTSSESPTVIPVAATTMPATTMPATTMPATTMPATTMPATTMPATTMPATTMPATTMPATTMPAMLSSGLLYGSKSDGTVLVPCLANYVGGRHPGKKEKLTTSCGIGYGGNEIQISDYSVDFKTGNESYGAVLYPCLANYSGGKHPGKRQQSWSYCNIGYEGKELSINDYTNNPPN